MKVIMGGHWDKAPDGWTALTEKQQDITRRLNYGDGTVDVIFTEHVIEHIPFIMGIWFMREAFRVLKPGGILRTAAPMTHVFKTTENHPQEFVNRYIFEQMRPYYEGEIKALTDLGLAGLGVDVEPFLFNFLMSKHGHQFCWSGKLMAAVLQAVGFKEVAVVSPGVSTFDPSTCLERRIRGTNAERIEKECGKDTVFDPETGVVEARK